MKRNPLSHRTKKWMERNDVSFSNVEEKIKKLCDNVYHIINYKFDFIDLEKKQKAMWIYKNPISDKYLFIKFNYEKICLDLYEGKKLLNQYNRDDCWILILQKSKEWSEID